MSETVLEVPVRAQEQTLWCWAAVTSGISAAYSHTPLAPCRIAAEVLNHRCCADPVPCNQEGALGEALAVVGIGSTPRETHEVGFTDVVHWVVGRGLPIGARIQDRSSGAGHFVLIIGCDPKAAKVVCADPFGTVGFAAPRYRMPYETFLRDYGGWGECTGLHFIG